jgi:hypothetical protein
MARTTRSSTQHHEKEREKLSDNAPAQPRSKLVIKKRKRPSISHDDDDDDDQPASKQLRSDWEMKEETSPEPEHVPLFEENIPPQLQLAADVPIDVAHSQKILDILEMWVITIL